MVFVSKSNKIKANKAELKKLETESALDKDKLMKEHRMLEIKFNLRNKFKVKKENRKTIKLMQEKSNRTISKCKETLRVICIRNKNKPKVMRNKQSKKKQINKWDQ